LCCTGSSIESHSESMALQLSAMALRWEGRRPYGGDFPG
jgi:hypothetical protein